MAQYLEKWILLFLKCFNVLEGSLLEQQSVSSTNILKLELDAYWISFKKKKKQWTKNTSCFSTYRWGKKKENTFNIIISQKLKSY